MSNTTLSTFVKTHDVYFRVMEWVLSTSEWVWTDVPLYKEYIEIRGHHFKGKSPK